MKIINANHPVVIMRWDEFRSLLLKLPADELIPYLHEAGYNPEQINKLLTKSPEVAIDRIFIEIEENV
jgi:hypothetical protein